MFIYSLLCNAVYDSRLVGFGTQQRIVSRVRRHAQLPQYGPQAQPVSVCIAHTRHYFLFIVYRKLNYKIICSPPRTYLLSIQQTKMHAETCAARCNNTMHAYKTALKQPKQALSLYISIYVQVYSYVYIHYTYIQIF